MSKFNRRVFTRDFHEIRGRAERLHGNPVTLEQRSDLALAKARGVDAVRDRACATPEDRATFDRLMTDAGHLPLEKRAVSAAMLTRVRAGWRKRDASGAAEASLSDIVSMETCPNRLRALRAWGINPLLRNPRQLLHMLGALKINGNV